MNKLDQEITKQGLRELMFTSQRAYGNVEEIWNHPDGLTLYRLTKSTEWHVNTIFQYPSIDYSHTIQTYQQLRDVYLRYLEERRIEISKWK